MKTEKRYKPRPRRKTYQKTATKPNAATVKKNTTFLLFSYFCILTGMVFLGVGIYLGFGVSKNIVGNITDGRVVSINYVTVNEKIDSTNIENPEQVKIEPEQQIRDIESPIVEYRVGNRSYTYNKLHFSSKESFKIGQKVKLKYNKIDPSKSEFVQNIKFEHWIPTLIALSIGLLLSYIGMILGTKIKTEYMNKIAKYKGLYSTSNENSPEENL